MVAWRPRRAARPRNSARIAATADPAGTWSVAPLGSAEPARNRDFSFPHPTPTAVPVHSDLLKPPEEAAVEARMLSPVTPRPQQPVRPARSVRMPPSQQLQPSGHDSQRLVGSVVCGQRHGWTPASPHSSGPPLNAGPVGAPQPGHPPKPPSPLSPTPLLPSLMAAPRADCGTACTAWFCATRRWRAWRRSLHGWCWRRSRAPGGPPGSRGPGAPLPQPSSHPP